MFPPPPMPPFVPSRHRALCTAGMRIALTLIALGVLGLVIDLPALQYVPCIIGGVAGSRLSRTVHGARVFLIGAGIMYVSVSVYGLIY